MEKYLFFSAPVCSIYRYTAGMIEKQPTRTEGLEMDLSLHGRTALVCGASKGIGRACALQLAGQGAAVVALARSGDALTDLLEELPGNGHHALPADLNDRSTLAHRIEALLKERGSIGVLVCNTGGPPGGPLLEADEAAWLGAFGQHVLVNALLVRLLAPGMAATGFGRVINIISTSVKAPIPNLGVSNTMRGAVASQAKTLAGELAADGITVNNVLPGYTATGRLQSLIDGAATRQGRTGEDVSREWQATVPAGRFGRPEEVAAAVGFLASPAAAYINGINLPVDGGRTPSL